MRNFFVLTLSFMILLATIPCISLFYKDEVLTRSDAVLSSQTTAATATNEKNANKSETVETATKNKQASSRHIDKVKVWLHKQKKTVTVTHAFYLMSVLAKEIDIHAPDEALKAQAVCIETFLKRTAAALQDKPYDISDDPAVHQAFLTQKALKDFWGEDYEKNYKKLQKILTAVDGEYLRYQGEVILAAYHSCNAGKTESAANYWGKDYPYLISVASPGDTLTPFYRQSVSLSAKSFQAKLGTLSDKAFSFSDSPSDWLGEIRFTPAGTVSQMEVAGVTLSGREVRSALGLKSAFFTPIYRDGKFIFEVSGYGHGVGLSQEGAKYLAKLGFDYKQILTHYYKGVEIVS